MCNRVQLSIMAAWCRWHGKELDVGAIEWIRLYAGVFRQIMDRGSKS